MDGQRRRPRVVFLHPSDLPKKAKLEKLLKETKSSTTEASRPCSWQEGEVLWGKIKGFPYWPCMVTRDPFSQIYAKPYGELYNSLINLYILIL